MPNIEDFTPRTLEQNADSFSNFLPTGLLWTAAFTENTIFRNFIKGAAIEMGRWQETLQKVALEYIPNMQTSFIPEWEQTLGIPDSCFSITNQTDAIRRRNILIKFTCMNLQTEADYIKLATSLGLSIQIVPYDLTGVGFPYTFPFSFFDPAFDWKIIIFTEIAGVFPYTFPMTFDTSDPDVALFECIVNKQKPAHTEVTFELEPNQP